MFGKAHLRSLPFALSIACAVAGGALAQGVRSTAEGVYSAEQAERGHALYDRRCASCHGDRLQGAQGGGALMGPAFNEGWAGQPAQALFDVIGQMPPGDAARLSSGDSADVMAYILSRNGHPAGPGDLPDYTEGLMGLTLAPPPAR